MLISFPLSRFLSFSCFREVLCVQLLFLRIISGCADGKIRILNLLTGECIRVLRGNSKCDPVLSLSATEERYKSVPVQDFRRNFCCTC